MLNSRRREYAGFTVGEVGPSHSLINFSPRHYEERSEAVANRQDIGVATKRMKFSYRDRSLNRRPDFAMRG